MKGVIYMFENKVINGYTYATRFIMRKKNGSTEILSLFFFIFLIRRNRNGEILFSAPWYKRSEVGC